MTNRINKARWLTLLAVVLITPVAILPSSMSEDSRNSRPNVILFLVDDMGWMDSSTYGSRYYETPNIERLARLSMRFTDAYATPVCSTTRASILSGQHSARHGITTATGHLPPQPKGFRFMPDTASPDQPVVKPISKNYLEPDQYTIPEALRDAGYRTVHIGKWHLGVMPQHWPGQQGFELTFHAAPDAGPPSYFSPYGVVGEGRPSGQRRVGNITDGAKGEYITDRLTDEALEFIETHRGKPFFLNLWHYGVHGPWGHKEEYTAQFAKKTDPRGKQHNPIMASMLKSIDGSLGRVLDKLDELQLTENTVFIFYSDNGGNVHSNVPGTAKTARVERSRPERIAEWRRWAGNHPPTSNAPLRSGKGSLYEGGSRVPLIVRWPGVVEPGTTSGAVVGAIDFYPTLLDLLGLAARKSQRLDGESFGSVLKGGEANFDQAFFNFFPHDGPTGEPGGVWVRRGNWKLIRWFETGPGYPDIHELYNLGEDIGELSDLAEVHPELVKELDLLIDRFFKDTQALVPKANPVFKRQGA